MGLTKKSPCEKNHRGGEGEASPAVEGKRPRWKAEGEGAAAVARGCSRRCQPPANEEKRKSNSFVLSVPSIGGVRRSASLRQDVLQFPQRVSLLVMDLENLPGLHGQGKPMPVGPEGSVHPARVDPADAITTLSPQEGYRADLSFREKHIHFLQRLIDRFFVHGLEGVSFKDFIQQLLRDLFYFSFQGLRSRPFVRQTTYAVNVLARACSETVRGKAAVPVCSPPGAVSNANRLRCSRRLSAGAPRP
jgi:hypothetical protein